MYKVYVLRSMADGKKYIGFTSKELSVRVEWHRLGSNRSTKHTGPYELIYFEEFSDRSVALAREKFFKTGAGRRVLDRKIRAISSVG